MSDKMIKKGLKGDDVSTLQTQLTKLGYPVKVDGHFGDETEKTVKELQTAFGYDVDGIVGPGTTKLITQQLGYGWNKNAPDAMQKAQQAQGKGGAAPSKMDGMAQKGGGLPPEKMMGAAPGQPQSPPKDGMAPKPQGAKK